MCMSGCVYDFLIRKIDRALFTFWLYIICRRRCVILIFIFFSDVFFFFSFRSVCMADTYFSFSLLSCLACPISVSFSLCLLLDCLRQFFQCIYMRFVTENALFSFMLLWKHFRLLHYYCVDIQICVSVCPTHIFSRALGFNIHIRWIFVVFITHILQLLLFFSLSLRGYTTFHLIYFSLCSAFHFIYFIFSHFQNNIIIKHNGLSIWMDGCL